MPCGIMITRKKLMEPLFQPVEYLNSVDSTITGSRNGQSSLYIWNVLVDKGIPGLTKDANNTMKNAEYLLDKMKTNKISCFKNKLSSTIIFQKPSQKIIDKWQLACTSDIAHVVIMPSVSITKINLFLEDLKDDLKIIKCLNQEIKFNCLCPDC